MEIFLLYLSKIRASKCQGIVAGNWITTKARLGYRFSAFYGRVPVTEIHFPAPYSCCGRESNLAQGMFRLLAIPNNSHGN